MAGDAMLEILQFLDRSRLDVGQLVSSEWSSDIEQWAHKLPVYTITASFRRNTGDVHCTEIDGLLPSKMSSSLPNAEWRAEFVNTSSSFDVKPEHNFLFNAGTSSKIPSEAIYRHLRNALVKNMRSDVAKYDLEWTLKMLNGLHSNCRIDALSVCVMSEQYRDPVDLFRSALDTRKVRTLELTISDTYFKDLIKNHRFLEWPSMRRLESISVEIRYSHNDLQPYYMPDLYQLESCKHISNGVPDLTNIPNALRNVLEEFVASGRELAVERFELILLDRVTTFVDREKLAIRDVFVGETSGYAGGKAYYYHKQSDISKVLTVFIHGRHRPRGEIVRYRAYSRKMHGIYC